MHWRNWLVLVMAFYSDSNTGWRHQQPLFNNLFNVMPDRWGATNNHLFGDGKPIEYSQYSPLGYNGTAYYLRLGWEF